MQTFSTFVARVPGLRYIAGELQFLSGVGRRVLDNSVWLSSAEEIDREFSILSDFREALLNPSIAGFLQTVRVALMQIRDIRSTLKRLEAGENLGDVELFEIKGLANASMRIGENLPHLIGDYKEFPDLSEVVILLDPEHTGASSFHIYDCYSEELATLRGRYEESRKKGNEEEAELLMTASLQEESRIRKELSSRLAKFSDRLNQSLEMAGELDLRLAKTEQMLNNDMIIPIRTEGETELIGMWHPDVKKAVEDKGGTYQKVEITFGAGVTLITGANMAGKSVVLKSAGLIQAMFQFGFAIPAREARICPVSDIMTSIGDGQSELEGLSSFAAEMQRIDSILSSSIENKILALIDEPARTTNPEEGKAIVEALTEIMSRRNSETLITTHYSVNSYMGRRLRVRGLDRYNDTLPLTPERIGAIIDYTLTEDSATDPPREALRIASMLGIDKELIELSAEKIKPKYAKE